MHIEGVPNPHAIKFVLENGILSDEPYEFCSLEEAEFSPLARRLMMLRYVQRVLIHANYITVVKLETGAPHWDEVLTELRALILAHLEDDQPILYIGAQELRHREREDVILALAKDILEQNIRPYAQTDGGDILIDTYENGVLNVSMHGSCYRCPYATETIQKGLEPLLRNIVPEIKKVTVRENGII